MKPAGWTNCDVRDKIVASIVKLYKWALAEKNSNDLKAAGVFMGAGLHFLQDTYCMTHTEREWTPGIDGKMQPGTIVNFQDYRSPEHQETHRNDATGCVALNENSTPKAKAAHSAAFEASVSLLKKFTRNVPAEDVQKWLIAGPLKMPKCDCKPGGGRGGAGSGPRGGRQAPRGPVVNLPSPNYDPHRPRPIR